MRIGSSTLSKFYIGATEVIRLYRGTERVFPTTGEFGALTPQTFNEDTGVQTYVFAAATGPGLTWTYSVTSGPAGLTLVSATRTISFNTDTMETVTNPYTIRATDQFGGVIEQDGFITITPTVPQPLLATATDDTIFLTEDAVMTAYDITQNFTLNGNSGSYAVTGLPTGLSVVASEIVGTPTVASSGTIAITFTDSFSRETVSSVAYTVAPAPAIFSNFTWDAASGVLTFDATQTGSYTWEFGAASGNFTLVAGANEPSIDLSAYAGETRQLQIVKDGQTLVVDAALTVPGSASLITPVVLGVAVSGTNTTLDPFTADYPAHNIGDGLLVIVANDNRAASIGPVVVTAPGGETVYEEQAIFGDGTDTSNEQTLAAFTFVANATRAAGTGIGVDIAFGDQHIVGVIRLEAGTFKAASPRLGSLTPGGSPSAGAVSSAALTGAQAAGLPFFACNYAFNPPDDAEPAGWTEHVLTDIGALVLQIATRNAAVETGGTVAAAQFDSTTSNNFATLTGVILPNGV